MMYAALYSVAAACGGYAMHYWSSTRTQANVPVYPQTSNSVDRPLQTNVRDAKESSLTAFSTTEEVSDSASQFSCISEAAESDNCDPRSDLDLENHLTEEHPSLTNVKLACLPNEAIRGNFTVFRGIVENLPFEDPKEGTKDILCALLRYAAEHSRVDILRECRQALWEKIHRDEFKKTLFIKTNSVGLTDIDENVKTNFYCCWGKLVNGRGNDGNTPLLIALKNKNLDCAIQLLAWGADLFLPNAVGECAIDLVSRFPLDSEMRAVVMGVFDDSERIYFVVCCSEENSDRAASLADLTDQPERAMRVLGYYVMRDDSARIKDLLFNETDVKLITATLRASKHSPLYWAAARGKAEALSAMIEKLPFDVLDSCTEIGRNILMLAAEYGHLEIITNYFRALREKYMNYYLDTKIMYFSPVEAEIKSRLSCADSPTESFREQWRRIVNAADYEGNTPLLLAIKNDHPECARFLLAEQAGLFHVNQAGESGVSIACDLPIDSTMRKVLFDAMPPLYRVCANVPCYVSTPGVVEKRWLWDSFWGKLRDQKDSNLPLIQGVDMDAAMSVELVVLTKAISIVEQSIKKLDKTALSISFEESEKALGFATILPEMAKKWMKPPKTLEQAREILLLCEAVLGFKKSLLRSDQEDAQYSEELLTFRRKLFKEIEYEKFKKSVMDCRETMGLWA